MDHFEKSCGVCQRICETIEGKNRYLVKELSTGYVVLGDYQRFPGYTLFLCKKHATELHFLEEDFRKQFLWEMSLTAEAVHRAFGADKINYELLGQGRNAHLHWHIFPRKKGDTPKPGPVWQVWPEEMYDERFLLSDEELEKMKQKLLTELNKRL